MWVKQLRGWAVTGLAAGSLFLAAAGAPRADHHVKDAPAKAKQAAAEKAQVKTDPAHDAMMAEMMKYALPGPPHESLKKAAGKWNATVKMWSAPGEPNVSTGTSENQMVLGGRYLEQHFTGTFMDQPFEGYGITGFDNKKKEYFSIWIDNTSTGMMSSTGAADETGKVITMTSMSDGPDGKPMQTRTVSKIVDDDTHVFSMYGTMGGQEMLMMEITYSRAK